VAAQTAPQAVIGAESHLHATSERMGSSSEQRRVELVQRLLVGVSVDRTELAGLYYEFDVWHLGVIATGARAREALAILKTGLNCRLLWVPHSGETVWAWLGGQRRFANADIEHMHLERAPGDVSLAGGAPGKGVEGWRMTHRQAQEALQVALIKPQKLTWYADIALLTPWLQDPDRARSLVEFHLSPLVSQRDGGVASRRTLRAYFEASRNVSAAAVKLGVERRTLAYRLRTIEERLGYRLDARLAELEVALRLQALLSDQN
jgi:DNA-binding PucR family transcriptional regulator